MKTVKNSFQIVLFCGLALFSPAMNHLLAAGAITPFTVLEAEAGTLAGGATIRAFTPGATVPGGPTMELEASGMAYAWLTNVNQSVSLTNPVDGANAVVIRSCIPDAPNGGGITATIDLYVDGVFRQAITLSSKQSWNYRNSTTTPDDPNGGGSPWHFYNEDRALVTGTPIAAGSIITLQEDAGNTAAFYDIDSIDLEDVPSAITQPANSLCITNSPYKADPTFTTDSTIGIQNCINDARSQGKVVWIPQGKFMVNSLASGALNMSGVTVQGAGVWYSTLYRNVPIPPSGNWRSEILTGTGSVLRDFNIDSDAIYRGNGGAGGDDYGINGGGNNWVVDRIWVRHCDAQWLSGSNGIIQNCRVSDSWADGMNLNNGNSLTTITTSITASNNFVRGSGDDNIATYSDSGASGVNPQLQGAKIINNTSVACYGANGIRIAGGTNVIVQGNLVDSVASNNGIEVSVFGNTGNPLDSALVTGNVVLRSGGWNGTDRHGIHVSSPGGSSFFPNAYTRATITNNLVQYSLRVGIEVGATFGTLIVSHNVIDHPAKQGVSITSGVTGSGIFEYNLVTNLNSGQVQFANSSPTTFTTTDTSNSWDVFNPNLLIKADTVTMNLAADWGGTAPAAGKTGQFDNTISANNATNLTLADNVALDSLNFLANLNGPVIVGSGNTLTLATSTGLNIGAANFDVTLNCALSSSAFNIASGRTLTLGGGSASFLSGTSAGLGTILLNSTSAKTFTANGNPSVNMGNSTSGVGGLVISNNCTLTDSGSFIIGNSAAGVVTLNSPTAAFNATGGAGAIMAGRNGGATGKLVLLNGSVSTAGSTTPAGIVAGCQLSSASARGVLDIQGGTLAVPLILDIGGAMSAGSGSVTMEGGTATVGTINFGGANGSSPYANSTGGSGSLTLTGGTLFIGAGGMNSVGTGTFTSTRTLSGGTIGATADWSSSLPITLATTGGNITFQAADAGNAVHNITLSGILSGAGGLIKTGNGTLNLGGTNTYIGSTIINAGTLALSGAISNTTLINLGSSTTFDVASRTDSTFTLNNGQTLMGYGSINGKLVTLAGSTLSPGASIGTLTVTNDIVLGGKLLLELNRTNAQTSDKLNSILGTITGGGTLTVTNIGPGLQAGDTFQLFSSAVSGFASVTLPAIDPALVWTNKLAVDGSIQVLAVPPPINPLPGQIQFSASGNTLNLSWPTNSGWLLQMQTNSLADTSWITLPGSDQVTSTNITINPANGAAFYRLVHP